MDFLIFLFGAIYVGICLFNESVDKEVYRRKRERRDREMEKYKISHSECCDVNNLINRDRYGCIDRCKEYILPFAPDLNVSYDRLKTIMFAMNGHYQYIYAPPGDTTFVGHSSHIQNQVEFWHQVENALHDAGKTDAKFYWYPPFGKNKEVVIDESGKPQFPLPGSRIEFGEEANIFPHCMRMW